MKIKYHHYIDDIALNSVDEGVLKKDTEMEVGKDDAIFVIEGKLTCSETKLTELSHLINKVPNTFKAKAFTKYLLMKADKVKSLLEVAKAKLASDLKAFCISDFKVLKMVGEGSYGKVFLCWNDRCKQTFAIKRLVKKEIEACNYMSNLENESKCLKYLRNSDNFVHLFKQLEDQTYIYQILEYVDGYDLETFLDDYMPAGDLKLTKDKPFVRMMLRRSLEALWYLNYHRLIHRDIKPANLMLDRECNFKVIDYGNMRLVARDERLSSFLGTPLYISPEVVRGTYGLEADYWSIGAVAYEFIFGQILFQNPSVTSVKDIYRLIINFDINKHKELAGCDPEVREVLKVLLDSNRERRLKKIVPKEIVGLSLFTNDEINFDQDPEEATEKVINVISRVKNAKKDGIEYLREKAKNKTLKSVAEHK